MAHMATELGQPGAARVDWVDYAKGFCIVMVVMMHSTLGVEAALSREGWLHYAVAFAKPFRMPDFFLISGLFLARVIDRCTVIRSMTHPYPIHGTAYSVSGAPTLDTPMQDNPRDPRHWPFIGSVVDYVDGQKDPRARPPVPRNIALPFLHSSRRKHPIHNAGPYGAFLGRAYDPVWTEFEGEALQEASYEFGGKITAIRDPHGGVHLPQQLLRMRSPVAGP